MDMSQMCFVVSRGRDTSTGDSGLGTRSRAPQEEAILHESVYMKSKPTAAVVALEGKTLTDATPERDASGMTTTMLVMCDEAPTPRI